MPLCYAFGYAFGCTQCIAIACYYCLPLSLDVYLRIIIPKLFSPGIFAWATEDSLTKSIVFSYFFSIRLSFVWILNWNPTLSYLMIRISLSRSLRLALSNATTCSCSSIGCWWSSCIFYDTLFGQPFYQCNCIGRLELYSHLYCISIMVNEDILWIFSTS